MAVIILKGVAMKPSQKCAVVDHKFLLGILSTALGLFMPGLATLDLLTSHHVDITHVLQICYVFKIKFWHGAGHLLV